MCMCASVYVFKSTSKVLERQGGPNKQKTPNKQKKPGTIVRNGDHPKLEAPLCQGDTLQILKHLAAKPFIQRVIRLTEC